MNFEILVSTMFRTDLDFLDKMFSKNDKQKFQILIINQTDEDRLLVSENPKINVINSFERGTSASRNLAIENCIGEVCLFADDDTIFESNFDKIILNEIKTINKNVYLFSFESTSGSNKQLHLNYPKQGLHNKKTLKKVHMITMVFYREKLLNSKIRFNKYFSLGGKFSGGTEYVFLRDAYSRGMNAYHIKKTIVHHIDEISSGKKMDSDQKIHTLSARYNHFYGSIIAFLWLCKYIFFLMRNKLISANEIIPKFKVGIKGIRDYDELLQKGLIKRQQ